ncbi:MAG: hypothetical protein FJZ07_02005 [Candidatus Nealsonbacteria bacterium]|nr:hypothetical protein [Candidatus Nealsonbacteria bacterium]
MNLPVKKIELILPKNRISELVEELQSGAFLEVIAGSETQEAADKKGDDYGLRLSEVNFALSFLENFKPKENFIKNIIFGLVSLKENIKESELRETVDSAEVKTVIQKCALLEEKINKLEVRKKQLFEESEVLEKFCGASIASGKILERVSYFIGSIDNKSKDDFLNEIAKRPFYLEKGKEGVFDFNFVLFYPQKEKRFFSEIFKKYPAKEENVFWQEEPCKALAARKKEIGEIGLELDIQRKEAQKLLFFVPKFRALSDWLNWQIEKENFLKQSEKTKKYLAFKAWVAEENIEKVRQNIKKITNHFLLKELPVSDEDRPPVIVKNKGIMNSFGIVTAVYGLPKRDELDPTPYLAPFFIFYFALALSDSGYGLILTILALLTRKIFKNAGIDAFLNLFIIAGILTTIVGVFAGTVFGSNITESIRIIDPLNDPIKTLIFVLFLGIFQIFIGLIVGMVWLIKSGKRKQALAGNGASIVFFIGIFLFFLTRKPSFIFFGLAVMIFMAIFYSLEKNIFLRIGKGFGAIYGLVGYFSDVLSYSRILALGLATGIIAAVINIIAVIFKDMVPIPAIGWLVAVIVLIIGHIGNLLINVLGAFIHSARLQFVEFFSKFMEGGGKYFKPFAKKGRFIEIIN